MRSKRPSRPFARPRTIAAVVQRSERAASLKRRRARWNDDALQLDMGGGSKVDSPDRQHRLPSSSFCSQNCAEVFFRDVDPEAVGTVADLAKLPGLPSAPVIRALIQRHPDFPLVGMAPSGRGPLVNLATAAQFCAAVYSDGRKTRDPRPGTLLALARLPGMPSEPVLRMLIREHRDFPLLSKGSRGQPHVIDMDEAPAFVRRVWSDKRFLTSSTPCTQLGDQKQ